MYRLVYHYELARIRGSLSAALRRDLTAASNAALQLPFGSTAFKFYPAATQADELGDALASVRLRERAAA